MAEIFNYVKFMRGTPTAFANSVHKNEDTMYFIYEPNSKVGQLWIGERLISSSVSEEGVIAYLHALNDVDTTGAINKSLLGFDSEKQKWVPMKIEDLVKIPLMSGATENTAGLAGLAPAPAAGDNESFLRGDGTWAKISQTASGIQIFETELNGKTHAEAINSVTSGKEIHSGDLVVIKDLIYENKYTYIVYIYKNKWTPMDGNYKAENVYFSEDLITTVDIGEIDTEGGTPTVIAAAGKTIKQVFDEIFYKEFNPEIILPDLINVSIEPSGYFEVGTEINPKYHAEFTTGNYSYGPETNVAVTEWIVSDTNGITSTVVNVNQVSGSLSKFVVNDNTDYHVTMEVDYSDGSIPLTNLGNEYLEGQIKAGNKTVELGEVHGYRSYFYGIAEDLNEINSDYIRALINGGQYNTSQKIIFKASEVSNPKRFILALPVNREREGLISAELTSTMNMNILNEYNHYIIKVAGINGYALAEYDVYIYEPSMINSDEIHTLLLA